MMMFQSVFVGFLLFEQHKAKPYIFCFVYQADFEPCRSVVIYMGQPAGHVRIPGRAVKYVRHLLYRGIKLASPGIEVAAKALAR